MPANTPRPSGRSRTAAKAAEAAQGLTDGGQVSTAVAKFLAGLAQLAPLTPKGEVLAASACACARQLDAGAGMSTAAVAKQLAVTLETLEAMAPTDDPVARSLARAQASRRRTP